MYHMGMAGGLKFKSQFQMHKAYRFYTLVEKNSHIKTRIIQIKEETEQE